MTQLEVQGNRAFTYNQDKCAMVVSYATITALDLKTDEIYYEEYHTASSADISTDRKHLVTISQDEVLVFDTSQLKPVCVLTLFGLVFGIFCEFL